LRERLAALLPGPRADHFGRPDRRPIVQVRDRLEARLRGMEMALRAAAADNHKDAQRFTEASLRLATLERELGAAGRELARAEARVHYLDTEERHLKERLGRLAAEVAGLDAAAQQLGMRPDPGVAALLDAAHETLEREPVSLEVAGRALDGLLGATEAYRERIQRLSERLTPRPGTIMLYKARQEARLPGRDPEH